MMNLHKLINDAEFKLELLPESYFISWFETSFLPEIKKFKKELYDKCNIQADSLKEAEFLNEIRKII